MGRVVKDAEVRRKEILDTAQYLYYSKGYEQTTIQDIIDEVGIAKGTFYHHFDSKQGLLYALIDRILDQIIQSLEPMINDDQLSALEKFNRFISDSTEMKFENQDVLKTFMQVYYQEDNAIMRERTQMESIRQVAPLLAQIIHQGVAEGIFVTTYPDICAEIILQISQNMSHKVIHLFLMDSEDMVIIESVNCTISAHEEAIARVLGAPPDLINVADIEIYRRWFEA